MRQVKTVYDGMQHCTSTVTPLGKSVATDCPHTGKGEEISPTNLVIYYSRSSKMLSGYAL